MDYTQQPLLFQARKALRYVRLYGAPRTLVKVRSQYHMDKTYQNLPIARGGSGRGRHVAIIGSGKFAYAQVAYYLTKRFGPVVRAAMDINVNRAASLFERYDLDYYTADASRIFADPDIDLVYIASNHASHTEYAIEALRSGQHVHIEKPHVVSRDQLERLCRAMEESSSRVGLGFNRPRSPFGLEVQRALRTQSGPAMLNWFIAGHRIEPDHWYFSPSEGGRVLGNLCHWTDFLYQMVAPEARYPITIRPLRAEQSDCDIAVTYRFGDGTIAAITFSAKGHTFEGVRERFAAHRGDVLITLDDFETLRIDSGPRRRSRRLWYRDHGHEANIVNSYGFARPGSGAGEPCSVQYVSETGELFLATREALEEDRSIVLTGYRTAAIAEPAHSR